MWAMAAVWVRTPAAPADFLQHLQIRVTLGDCGAARQVEGSAGAGVRITSREAFATAFGVGAKAADVLSLLPAAGDPPAGPARRGELEEAGRRAREGDAGGVAALGRLLREEDVTSEEVWGRGGLNDRLSESGEGIHMDSSVWSCRNGGI